MSTFARRMPLVLAVLVTAWLPRRAEAGNGAKPRTPVVWSEVPCMTVVDRSTNPVVHLAYGIAAEDPAAGESLAPDEVTNSRTHQFFAFAREHEAATFLPNWITMIDVEAAVAKGLVDPASITPDEVLETSAAWTGAWFRIVADDERRPITFAMAEQGVDWDTAGLPAGTYHVEGYTFEPAFNLFRRRPGVVKITDGGAPEEYGPAVGLAPDELILYRDGFAELRGCVDGMAGTTLSAEWAPFSPANGVDWVAFAEDVPVDDPSFALELAAPAALAGEQGMLRVTGRDPRGRSYTAYLSVPFTVLDEDDPNACAETGSFVGQPGCGESTGAGATSSSGDGSTASLEPSEHGGCAAGGPSRGRVVGCVVVLLVVGATSRRAGRR